mgnify:CR=1 FL=1
MDYKNTLNLPQTAFPMKADLIAREPARLQQWETAGLKRQDFVVNYGSEADVAHILATYGKPIAEPAAASAPE